MRFLADPAGGQKTGWFYDQRENRAADGAVRETAARVLDLYSYTGGFGIQAARGGRHRSAGGRSLEPCARSAEARGEAERRRPSRRRFERGGGLRGAGAVDRGQRSASAWSSADPPAFVKSKQGPQRRRARPIASWRAMARQTVEPGGILFIASCSHNMPAGGFRHPGPRGLHEGGRSAKQLLSRPAPHRIIRCIPFLPESAYLKALHPAGRIRISGRRRRCRGSRGLDLVEDQPDADREEAEAPPNRRRLRHGAPPRTAKSARTAEHAAQHEFLDLLHLKSIPRR